jgi:hypothetical protein
MCFDCYDNFPLTKPRQCDVVACSAASFYFFNTIHTLSTLNGAFEFNAKYWSFGFIIQ